jgi:hypothetical protein
MEAKNINTKTTTLEQLLKSYNVLTGFLFMFIFLIIILLVLNPKGFNKTLGNELFITAPILLILTILIKEIIIFKNNPQESWLNIFPQSNEIWFFPLFIFIIIFIGLAGFFTVLSIGGVFSNSPPENNIATLINFLIIIIFLGILLVMYNKSKSKDDTILNSLPKSIQETFMLRTRYTLLFVLFVIFISALYFFNPYGIMTNYGGPVIFFSLFVGMIFVTMITIYQFYFSNPSKVSGLNESPGFLSFLTKGVYILGSIGISGFLIYQALNFMGVFQQDASKPESWGHIIFNLILFTAMLGIIYKLANAGGFLDKNPYYRLFLNTILYIPCLLVSLINSFTKTGSNEFNATKPYEYKILIISLVLLLGYFFWFYIGSNFIVSKYLKQGGKQLVNQPLNTDVLTNIGSYQTLSGSDKFNYQYAISFWFYIDSFPPSTNASYSKTVPILSYGDNPCIKYSSENNTLYISVKQKDDSIQIIDFVQEKETELKEENINEWKNIQEQISDSIEKVKNMPIAYDTDADGNRILYKHPNVQLQKWNQIVLNYNGGTLDIFYNGKLVKSAIEVVPYMKLDMLSIGSENGIYGNVANLMYFNKPLDIPTINTLYNSLKNKNPPVISENNKKLIPLS